MIVGVVVGCDVLIGDFDGMEGAGVAGNPCVSLQLRISNVNSAATVRENLWWGTLLWFILLSHSFITQARSVGLKGLADSPRWIQRQLCW